MSDTPKEREVEIRAGVRGDGRVDDGGGGTIKKKMEAASIDDRGFVRLVADGGPINYEIRLTEADMLRVLARLRGTQEAVVGMDQLHRYLADAFKRGADKQRMGDFGEAHSYERLVIEAESWAREFIDLRLENGLIGPPLSGDET